MMDNSDILLLCTADLHLGRHPGSIPEEYDEREYSPLTIWKKIVRRAVSRQVDALLIAGDVIDRGNRYFEAFGPLEAGIEKLGREGIAVLAVAGNHDYDILPRLSENISGDNFFFLGEGGRWENKLLTKKGEPVLNIIGWSYPSGQVRKNPLENFSKTDNEIPAIGLLHSEINNPASNYAPTAEGELRECGLKGWVLGHIHKEFIFSDPGSFILNPGSPQPLHFGEPGFHHVHEIKLKANGSYEINKCQLASLQYMNLKIDITGQEEITEFPAAIVNNIKHKLENSDEITYIPELIIVRIILEGKTPISTEIEAKIQELLELELDVDGSRIVLDKIYNKTTPALNLEKLAGGNSQAALLAEYLLKLQSGKEEELPEELLERLEEKLRTVYNSSAYQPLRRYNRISPPIRSEIFSILQKQAGLLLTSLLEQKEGSR